MQEFARLSFERVAAGDLEDRSAEDDASLTIDTRKRFQRRDFDRAERVLADLVDNLQGDTGSVAIHWARVAHLPIAIARSDAEWQQAIERVAPFLARAAHVDDDVVNCVQTAGERAVELGLPDRAKWSLEQAAAHWDRLGHADRALAARALLESL